MLGIEYHCRDSTLQVTAITRQRKCETREITVTIGRLVRTLLIIRGTWTWIETVTSIRITTIIVPMVSRSAVSRTPSFLNQIYFFYFVYLFWMNSFDHLPICQDVFLLLKEIVKIAISFPKDFKYTFWERLQNACLDLLSQFTLATEGFDPIQKLQHLQKAKEQLALLKVLRRSCNELSLLSHLAYTSQLTNLFNITQQLNKRMASVEKRKNTSTSLSS